MNQPRVTVRIDKKTGFSTVEAHNYEGQACLDATKAILAKLGPSQESQKKAEYYADGRELEQQRTTQG